MSDNIMPINPAADDVTHRIFVTVNGRDIQYDIEAVGITFDSSLDEIMNVVASKVLEETGVDIKDSYKVQKMPNNYNIYIFPNSTAG